MEVIYARCAGIDVHKKTVRVCLLIRQEHGKPSKEFRFAQLLSLTQTLRKQKLAILPTLTAIFQGTPNAVSLQSG